MSAFQDVIACGPRRVAARLDAHLIGRHLPRRRVFDRKADAPGLAAIGRVPERGSFQEVAVVHKTGNRDLVRSAGLTAMNGSKPHSLYVWGAIQVLYSVRGSVPMIPTAA